MAGPDIPAAVVTARSLASQGLLATVHCRRDWVRTGAAADEYVEEYAHLAEALAGCGVASPEISIKLEQMGLYAPGGEDAAVARAITLATRANVAGTRVTLDMEGVAEVDLTLRALQAIRTHEPDTGVALQAYLTRTERDCAELAGPGSRVRLCKGGYTGSGGAVLAGRHDVDLAYVRCLAILMRGEGRPMLATHDERLMRIAIDLARRAGRDSMSWEVQMLLGIRPQLAGRLVEEGLGVRMYVPYGPEWYPWFVRRVAERPANLGLLARVLLPGG